MTILSPREETRLSEPEPRIATLTRAQEVQASRNRALLIANADTVAMQNQNTLVVLQQTLQHGATYGFWETPRKWGKSQSGVATMNVDVRKRIEDCLPDEYRKLLTASDLDSSDEQTRAHLRALVDGAVLVETRYLVLLRMGPSALGRRGRFKSLDPSTVRGVAYSCAPQMLALSITKILRLGKSAEIGRAHV